MLKRHIYSAVAMAAISGLLVSCSGNVESDKDAADSGSVFTIDNCGFELEFKSTAKRAVSTEQAATDTLLALHVDKQMVGTANLKTAVFPEYQEKYEAIEKIAERVPTGEQLRSVDPDFVYSPFESVYTADGSGTREELKELGVNAYYSNVECRDYAPNKGKNAFDLIEKDVTELGTIFGAETRAKELVEDQHKIIAEAKARTLKTQTNYPSCISTPCTRAHPMWRVTRGLAKASATLWA